jgi:hypothetical protein
MRLTPIVATFPPYLFRKKLGRPVDIGLQLSTVQSWLAANDPDGKNTLGGVAEAGNDA